MLALQIQAGVLVFVWFALVALNNSSNGFLWGLLGGAIFAVVHVVAVYLLEGVFVAALDGSVAANGIYFLSRMTAILIGFVVCFFVLQALTRRSAVARA